jgi:hypothetical protein
MIIMKKRLHRKILLFLSIGLFTMAVVPQEYKESIQIPALDEDPASHLFGSRLQRTLTLFTSSSENQANKVRILFYGQSIVAGLDAEAMVDQLRKYYPCAQIEFENRAIGGFQAPNLVRTATHDLYPYYPDLLIFHVYGGEDTGELERIIHNTRKYTTADILLFNHQLAWVNDPDKLAERTREDDLSSLYFQYLAGKYGCELVDVRRRWKKYIDGHSSIGIHSLMGDTVHSNVHPNARGNKLLELMILDHLKPRPEHGYFPTEGFAGKVTDYEARRFFEEKDLQPGQGLQFKGWVQDTKTGVLLNSGECSLTFTGNRIELLTFSSDQTAGQVEIFIDGRRPSDYAEMYAATRPSQSYQHWRTALKRVTLHDHIQPDRWTLTLTRIDRENALIEFDLKGEQAGFDGHGSNRFLFVSNSGQIMIEPGDFFIFESEAYTKKETPEGFEISWEVRPLFTDTLVPGKEASVFLLGQGLSNKTHRLAIKTVGSSCHIPIKSIRVYSPPLQ